MHRLKLLMCAIFGHDWMETGREYEPGPLIDPKHPERKHYNVTLEEWKKCWSCGLEHHDRSGYKRILKLEHLKEK